MLSITSGSSVKKPARSGVIVDALPYIDNEYEETGMKEMVMTMIEEEKRRYRPTKNYLEHLPPLELHRFETELMKKEFERMSQRIPMEVLSMKRYELPPPPTGKLTDITAWTECLDNSYSQLEHQATRITNLELMLDYGAEGWKSYLVILNRMVADAQKKLQIFKREIQELNWHRKSSQLAAGEQFSRLEHSWVTLISKNYEIEQACMGKEFIKYEKAAELAQLKFIISDTESDRSGARIRRRVRRFFLQKRGPFVEDEEEKDEEEEEEEEEEAEEEIIEDEENKDQPPPSAGDDVESMETEEAEVEAEPEPEPEPPVLQVVEVNKEIENEEEEADEEAIGPQPYYYPDSDKIENDPERNCSDNSQSD